MATDPPPPTEAVDTAEAPAETVVVERRPLWQRVVKWGAIAVTGVVLIAGLLFAGLNTQPGRDFVAQQLNRLSLASGLNFRVGKIEGSLFGAMKLRDVEVRDTQGTFATAREMDRVEAGDLVVFRTAGAYAAAMSSTYNSRPLTPEVLVDGSRWALVRPRIEVDRLIAADSIPDWLAGCAGAASS